MTDAAHKLVMAGAAAALAVILAGGEALAAGTSEAGHRAVPGHTHEHTGAPVPHGVVETLGGLTGTGLLATIVLGLLFRRAHWRVFRHHRVCAFVTIGLGLCHGTLALLSRLLGG